MHVPAHVLCAQTEIRMAESEAASIVEATTESQDSQNTIEYSLQGTNGSLSGDTADHPENILAKKTHEADSPEGKTVSPGIKNPPEQMNTGENQGGQVEDGEGNNNLKDEKSKTDTQGQVSELVKKDSRDESQEDSNNQGKSENSALTEIVNKRESDDPTNQTSEGGSDPVPGLVKSEENSIPDTELGRNESQDQSSTSEKTDNQDSQEDSKEAMEQDEGENDEMEVDEETGQVAGAGSEPEHSAEGMDEEKFSSDSSDDDSYWGRPWASRDTQLYRAGYPGKSDNQHLNKNYKFYTNRLPSEPDGDYIERIHKDWKGNYRLLEIHHGYIQWLFPIRETGLNWHAQELQLHEIKKICADQEAHKRILISYELMLDFYGMKLKDPKTGELERAENWQSRFRHLNHSMHNYLRITRILKCLGEFNYEHLKAPFVQFVLREAIVEQTLKNTKNSCLNYWLEVIKDEKERKQIKKYAKKLSEHKNRKK